MADFLDIRALSRHFGGQRAVDDVSFAVAPHELTALIGPNGAGKTTLFNMLGGALAPTSGRVTFSGKTVRHSEQAFALGIARTFQNIRLFKHMSVLENVLTAMDGRSFLHAFYRSKKLNEAERLRMKQAYYILEDLHMAHTLRMAAAELPFGQQRLVEIARALAGRPRLLLLDEPAAGLNRTETTQLVDVIKGIHAKGVTVLIIEHDMHMVMKLARRIIVLEQGKIIADDTPEAIRNNPRVCEAYLGVS
ncbi:MAG: ABC transporter ATP-binding protein [Spartobacteria bacterium]|nr:ABC transporter ATP-binding protein [Spartobacteria bacterium]